MAAARGTHLAAGGAAAAVPLTLLAITLLASTTAGELAPFTPSPSTPLVHLLPHSHTDPGWKSTLENLYTTEVHTIFTKVIEELEENPQRTFNVEIAVFFYEFWQKSSAATRASILRLIAGGQLTFIGGGWSQPDEACTRFEDLIDNFQLGHLFIAALNASLHVRTSWQADPFGHSTTFTHLLTRLGMDLAVFGRPMQQGDPSLTQSFFAWHPTASHPPAADQPFDAFTQLTHQHGTQTTGYWEPFRSCHPALALGRVEAAAATLDAFISNVRTRGPPTAHVLVMMGDDFAYQDARLVFNTLDKVLASLNANSSLDYRIQYSTPERFVAALAGSSGDGVAAGSPPPAFPARVGQDMMPLLQGEFPRPWTGFYTSRPAFKALAHAASAAFRAASQLATLATPTAAAFPLAALTPLWRGVGLVQHHDAITGDAYSAVVADYRTRLHNGLTAAGSGLQAALGGLPPASALPRDLAVCFNVSADGCGLPDSPASGSTLLVVYNPLSWPRNTPISIAVPAAARSDGHGGGAAAYEVVDAASGTTVASQLSAPGLLTANSTLAQLSFLPASGAPLPPHGFRAYHLRQTAGSGQPKNAQRLVRSFSPNATSPAQTVTLSNNELTVQVTVAAASSLLNMTLSSKSATVRCTLGLYQYSSVRGYENAWDFHANSPPTLVPPAPSFPQASMERGAVYEQLVVQLDPAQGIAITLRLAAGGDDAGALEIYSSLGPLQLSNNSIDTVLQVRTDLESGGGFFTDSNGLEFQPRVRFGRPWWNGTYPGEANETVSNNYYPLASGLFIEDTSDGRAVMLGTAAGSQGGTSMSDGVLEAMAFRQVLDASTEGTGNFAITTRNTLAVAGSRDELLTRHRPHDARLANPPLLMAAPAAVATAAAVQPYAPLAAVLPDNIQLLSLLRLPADLNISAALNMSAAAGAEQAKAGQGQSGDVLLVRLRHIYAAGESAALAKAETLDLAALLAPRWRVVSAVETILSALQPMADAESARIVWPVQAEGRAVGLGSISGPISVSAPGRTGTASQSALLSATQVTLNPLDIKTFLVKVE